MSQAVRNRTGWREKGRIIIRKPLRFKAFPLPPESMVVLGIETSCDETGVALYDTRKGLLAHALHSQVAMHADYGGVVPELASRDHIRRLIPLTRRILEQSALKISHLAA